MESAMSKKSNKRESIEERIRKRSLDAEARINGSMLNSDDPVDREAAGLIHRMGHSWYHTESMARQVARFAANELLDLKTGYPHSLETVRAALRGACLHGWSFGSGACKCKVEDFINPRNIEHIIAAIKELGTEESE